MKRSGLVYILLSLFYLFYTEVSAQISHGGKPFFLQNSLFRSSQETAFEMPAFDLDSILQEDRLNEGSMQRSFRFAHKFFTKIEKRKDAALTILPDGTKVWQIKIRSKDACSINVLLTDFELPPGGKLFVYSSDHSHIVGSFDYRNNSPEKILPIQPVAGESIVIEYSEPAGVPFEGNFTVSEVNHDYRNFLRREPENNGSSMYRCMPDALCSGVDENLVRSTVLLMINGSTACSGVLANNTENDGTPYILTAVHCLNDSLGLGKYKDLDYYISRSGTIITFFNYNRPVCDNNRLKGTEEMTMAETYPRAIVERRDVALLELREKPPVYYNAYFAGWNMDENGKSGVHTNLHHPNMDLKRYGKAEADLSVASFYSNIFEPQSHWEVSGWTIGSTHGGSSGSPLFDKNGLLVGNLSGGSSECSNTSPTGQSDYFTILYKSWETSDANNQLKKYLDPADKGLTQQAGMDPNKDNPLSRLSNMNFSAGDSLEISMLSAPNSGYIYGSSNLNTAEFAEEFTINDAVEILGAYLFVPPLSSNGVTGVEISIYSGVVLPENLLQTQDFSPKYLDYSKTDGFNPKDKNMKSFGTESFVLFDKPVKIDKGKFFISYKIPASVSFSVYNAKFSDANKPNTAWVKNPSQGWIPANTYPQGKGTKTSLGIQALVRSTIIDSLPEIPDIKKDNSLFFDSKTHTLSFLEPVNEAVSINIYSLTGRLMEKTKINKGEKSVFLSEKMKGTIGIVQLILSNKIHSKKIIY